MNKLVEWIKKEISAYKLKSRATAARKAIEDINTVYQITESEGTLYLVVGSRAVKKFETSITIFDAIEELNAARAAQIHFLKIESNKEVSSCSANNEKH
jgi:hypothetical protein